MEHQWVNAAEGHQYCGKCGLLEWHARLDSECSGVWGLADEAEHG